MLSVNDNEFLFELKYRPQTIDECILPKDMKDIFKGILKQGEIPNMILQSNSPGTGKTTVALALCKELELDYVFVNGSDCKIDFVRNELTNFATGLSMNGKKKVIIIDEFDRSGLADSQRHLRSFMEAYSNNCTIIMTANDLDGIIDPLQSRSRVIQFNPPSKSDQVDMMKQMILRCFEICKNEGIEVKEKKVIASLVKNNFPDFRRTVNKLDMYRVKSGVIDEGILNLVLNTNDVSDVLDAIKSYNIKELRELAKKYSHEYSYFIEKFTEILYHAVQNKDKFKVYQLIGENNQFHGLAANMEIHLMHLFTSIVLEEFNYA